MPDSRLPPRSSRVTVDDLDRLSSYCTVPIQGLVTSNAFSKEERQEELAGLDVYVLGLDLRQRSYRSAVPST